MIEFFVENLGKVKRFLVLIIIGVGIDFAAFFVGVMIWKWRGFVSDCLEKNIENKAGCFG